MRDVILRGYPNWCGTVPMAVCTFLAAHGFAGKTILPFCTHEGSGLGRSERDIARLCPGAKVLKGLAIQGSAAQGAGKELSAWLRRSDVTAAGLPSSKDDRPSPTTPPA